MATVGFSQMAHAEKVGEGSTSGAKNQGTLKTEGKDYSVFVFSDSESVTEAVSKFLQEANLQGRTLEQMLDYEFVHITPEVVEVEQEIADLLKEIVKNETPKTPTNPKSVDNKHPQLERPAERQLPEAPKEQSRPEPVYSSLFSLARSFNSSLSLTKQKKEAETKTPERAQVREEAKSPLQLPTATKLEQKLPETNKFDREGDGKQGQDQKKDQEQEQEKKQKQKIFSIGKVQASNAVDSPKAENQPVNRPVQAVRSASQKPQGPVGGVENIYIRFMALMARILGQSEAEAHQLYQRIKERTDAIDTLTSLISKVNSEKGAIDWTNNEEMKKLVERARSLGVDIPEGKLKWTEDEKKLLKENIQMRKDSMEKITQLERTDMQRYLQESSQCHQARSNVLKLLKEVLDTIIHNMRPS